MNEVEAIVEPVGEDELERLRKKVEEQRLVCAPDISSVCTS